MFNSNTVHWSTQLSFAVPGFFLFILIYFLQVFRLLVAVLVVFLVCWLPMKIFMIVIAYNPQIVETTTEFQFYAYYITYFTCHLLAMSNSFGEFVILQDIFLNSILFLISANPVLYCFMSLSFRVSEQALKVYAKNTDQNLFLFTQNCPG